MKTLDAKHKKSTVSPYTIALEENKVDALKQSLYTLITLVS